MMASSDPDRRNGRGRRGRQRPPIWTGGRQRPPFDRAAFWRVTKANSRDLLWPLLARIGERFERGAHAVACGWGAGAVARLGKGARVLPPRRAVVAALRGTGLWLLVGADRIDRLGRLPEAETAEPDPFGPDGVEAARPARVLGPEPAATVRVTALRPARAPVREPTPTPAPPPAPPPAPLDDDPPREPVPPTLRAALAREEEALREEDPLIAIRAMMRAATAPTPSPRRPELPPPPEAERDPVTGLAALPQLAPPEPPAPGPALRAFGTASGLAFFVLTLPLGAALAGIAHLRGEDLRLRETD